MTKRNSNPKANRPVVENQFVFRFNQNTQQLGDARPQVQRAPRTTNPDRSSSNSQQQIGDAQLQRAARVANAVHPGANPPQQTNISPQHTIVQNFYINNHYYAAAEDSASNSSTTQQTFFGASGNSNPNLSMQQSPSVTPNTRPTIMASAESQRIKISNLVNAETVSEKALDLLTIRTLTEAFQTPPRNPEETEMDTEMLLPKFC
ncbi:MULTISPECIES: hypothetical protein [Legionella]|uniref:hypothetical protein n=1 Tax=Legionella TaxID=445 RepID=UPI000F8E07C9|nr:MULTISPECIES: hypothetical protein [Legionella]MCP0913329.1 hypothetical protein [Legionella sp. 27cVA30]RUQ98006.1 hypothetical protein ELY11_06025 [Legionella septentrionalis]RUR14686.1 hypothetical protein ELY10_08080 [Legionella septentrionalis]